MIDDDTIPVWVDRVEPQGTIAFGFGETPAGERVQFAADHRAVMAIEEALRYDDGPVLAAVPTWSLIGRPPAHDEHWHG